MTLTHAEVMEPAPRPPAAGRGRPPGARLAIMLAVFVAFSVIGHAAAQAAAAQAQDAGAVSSLVVGLGTAALAVALYRAVVQKLEARPAVELSPGADGLRRGVLLGFGLFLATILVIAALGGYRITGFGSFGALVAAVGVTAGVAVTEEIIFRGIVFRLVEEMTGTRLALAVSALLFGGRHLLNPDATVWGALAVSVGAGLLLGAAYAATGSLWLPIGLHFGWNLAEGGIYGTGTSGSLFTAVVHGPAALTGGAFGPEASVVAILVCGVPALFFGRRAARKAR